MSTDKIAKILSAGDLVNTSKSGNLELSKEELDSVSGGVVPIPYPNLGSKP